MADHLLFENGTDDLLMETGDFVLLEDGGGGGGGDAIVDRTWTATTTAAHRSVW